MVWMFGCMGIWWYECIAGWVHGISEGGGCEGIRRDGCMEGVGDAVHEQLCCAGCSMEGLKQQKKCHKETTVPEHICLPAFHACVLQVLKMDVEGYEPYVLLGAYRLLMERRVWYLVIEYNPFLLRAAYEQLPGFNASALMGYEAAECLIDWVHACMPQHATAAHDLCSPLGGIIKWCHAAHVHLLARRSEDWYP